MTIYCAKCGSENTEEAKFCVNCGSGLETPKSSSRFKGTMMMPGIKPGDLEKIKQENTRSNPLTPTSNSTTENSSLPPLADQNLELIEEDEEFANQPTLAMPSIAAEDILSENHANNFTGNIQADETLQLSAQPQTFSSSNTPAASTPFANDDLEDPVSIPGSSNTKASLLLAFALILIAVGGVAGWYFYTKQSQNAPSAETTKEEPTTKKAP